MDKSTEFLSIFYRHRSPTGIGTTIINAMPKPEFHYVYLLHSLSHPGRHYTGYTTNLSARLKKHNYGEVPHTAKLRPWRIETVIRFRSRHKARRFEKYLKSGSGREFARKHF